MPLIKPEGKEEYGLCPYCSPYSKNILAYDKWSNTIYCKSCGYAVKILGMPEPKAVKSKKIEIKHPDFRLNKVHPHLYD